MDMTERILTKREAAVELNVSIRTLERYISAGLIPAGKTLGGQVRVAQSVIDAVKTAPPTSPVLAPTGTGDSSSKDAA